MKKIRTILLLSLVITLLMNTGLFASAAKPSVHITIKAPSAGDVLDMSLNPFDWEFEGCMLNNLFFANWMYVDLDTFETRLMNDGETFEEGSFYFLDCAFDVDDSAYLPQLRRSVAYADDNTVTITVNGKTAAQSAPPASPEEAIRKLTQGAPFVFVYSSVEPSQYEVVIPFDLKTTAAIPATGDTAEPALLSAGMLLSLALMGALLCWKRRSAR